MFKTPSLLLLLLLLARASASLRSCVPPFITLHARSSPAFASLRSRSFLTSTSLSPSYIAPVAHASHVPPVVRCARLHRLRVCARSGGHSFTGASLCGAGAVLLDLSGLRAVSVRPRAGVVDVQPGTNMGELLWKTWHRGRRWVAAGVCPSVGTGGYVLGGGHGPYEGRLGLACDALVSVRLVDRFGRERVASRSANANLFWAMCGAGGGQLGIVTGMTLRTVKSAPFDAAVMFRFRWPLGRAGEVLEKWARYGEEGGDVWFRVEMFLDKGGERGVYGYGACYSVASTEACVRRLERAAFFNVGGRETVLLRKARSALDVHAFLGPEGGWGRKAAADVKRAMLGQRGKSGGGANGRTYQSTFLSARAGKMPGRAFWQKYAEFCARPGRGSIPWVVCEMNLFGNAVNKRRNNAFAHRGARIITHYIIGGGTLGDRMFAYGWMRRHLAPFTSGVYVNYSERELGGSYAKMYWGKSLQRLKKIKRTYDPEGFFANPQPIPK